MRLIDADAFRRELDNHWPFTKEEQSKHGIADLAKGTVLTVLGQMPTIEERTTGFWYALEKGDKGYSASDFKCSVCGEPNHTWLPKPNFCPNCGAVMRGEERGVPK